MNDSIMWPVRYDMTRDECRKCLRCLELDAYGSMVSVLRAQGPFTSEKQKLLQELARVLHISNERHRAEIRRAVNDEKLATIAEQLNGPNTGTDWTIEGRRAIPLLPRLKPRTTFTTLANSLSLATAAANERKAIVITKKEDLNDAECESQGNLLLGGKLWTDNECPSADEELCDTRIASTEIRDSNKNKVADIETVNHEVTEQRIISAKRKSPSPLPMAPPNKVLVVSSGSLSVLNHGAVEKGSENTTSLSHPTANLSQQNVTVIPFNLNCSESTITDAKELAEGNIGNQTLVQAGKYVNKIIPACTTSTAKSKGKITTTQNKLSTKVTPPVLLPGSSLSVSTNNSQSDTSDSPMQDNSNSKTPGASHSLQKTFNTGNTIVSAPNTKRVTSIVHSNTKSTTTKVTSNNSHRVVAVCPGTTASSGPGPPHVKQTPTMLTCKKLPTTLNHQTTAKSLTLNSNKTVNISQHPNTKLASKTNVIVIQKGHTKGVTLSHAGKEVLGKVIMGGKNLCVTGQHNTASVNVVPHHIALNNAEQAVTMLSSPNSSHTESAKPNIKPGNTIVFNLQQDVLEKNKVLSQLLVSSSVLTSETKTVIQNSNARSLKEHGNSDLHILEKEPAVKTDTVITSVKDEKQHRKSKDVYTNANSHVINSVDPSKLLGTKEILISSSQLINIQDDTISNIEIEDTICSSEIDMFKTSLGPTEINFENLQYLVEPNENHVEELRSPIISLRHTGDHNNS